MHTWIVVVVVVIAIVGVVFSWIIKRIIDEISWIDGRVKRNFYGLRPHDSSSFPDSLSKRSSSSFTFMSWVPANFRASASICLPINSLTQLRMSGLAVRLRCQSNVTDCQDKRRLEDYFSKYYPIGVICSAHNPRRDRQTIAWVSPQICRDSRPRSHERDLRTGGRASEDRERTLNFRLDDSSK